MNLFDIVLTAGVESQTTMTGRYFRILSGGGRIKLRSSNGVTSEVINGIGVDVGGFNWLRLTSPTDQTITVIISELPTTDSRLTGDIDINGLLEVFQTGGSVRTSTQVTATAGTATEILGTDPKRLSAQIVFNVGGRVGVDSTVTETTGFPVTAGGIWDDSNQGSMWFYSVDGGTVDIIEGFR